MDAEKENNQLDYLKNLIYYFFKFTLKLLSDSVIFIANSKFLKLNGCS